MKTNKLYFINIKIIIGVMVKFKLETKIFKMQIRMQIMNSFLKLLYLFINFKFNFIIKVN